MLELDYIPCHAVLPKDFCEEVMVGLEGRCVDDDGLLQW